jgi:hypothetical protein
MTKKLFLTLGILIVCTYSAALLNFPFVFIVLFACSFYFFIVTLLLAAWKMLPVRSRKNVKEHKILFGLVIVGWLILFLGGRMVINKYYASDVFFALRMLIKAALLLITMILAGISLDPTRKRATAICVCAYICFIILAPFITSNKSEAIDNTQPSALGNSRVSPPAQMASLPYLSWSPAEDVDKISVTKYDPQVSYAGINIYNGGKGVPYGYLLDMQGNILHEWNLNFKDDSAWNLAELSTHGDLWSICTNSMFAVFDWQSNRKMTVQLRAHHDFEVSDSGDIYVMARKDSIIFLAGWPVPLLEDYIAIFSSKGDLKKEVYFSNSIKKHFKLKNIVKIYYWIIKPKKIVNALKWKLSKNYVMQGCSRFDMMHTNTIELLKRNIEGLCRKDDFLISIRELDLVAVVDAREEKVSWSWGPSIVSKQHHPTLLDNGNILLFDNGVSRGYSRVIELDPLKKKIVWEYGDKNNNFFFSPTRGGNQRLPNGNTLITDGHNGRVFEVTPEGEMVWEFYNPEILREERKRRPIYRLMRITDPENYPCLDSLN